MSGARLAWAFLTRLPGGRHPHDPTDLGRAVPWFPWVGGVVGILSAATYAAASSALPSNLAALLAVAARVMATGALHEDGLADTFDGLGGESVERRLEIMKDSRVGVFGALALLATFLGRTLAIGALDPAQAWIALPVAHASGRALAVGLMIMAAPARTEGLGASYTTHLPTARSIASVSLVLVAAALSGPLVGIALAVGALAVALVSILIVPKFGGVTGDVLGAAEQVAELSVLSALVAIAPDGLLWTT